ncbi:hypothetical protein SH1V18_21000 [Vallitalea longa]|uniref:Uncharacterized protein n=1 Tax=Vallitalea longa TaxID=2936439 RepID=A0A9W5Y9A3_9FIRM|nr:hypothetical protein [Vallitalea longa]GKX29620.1 hypothetical protein SH1V18_21000 [Vallitalea longa]
MNYKKLSFWVIVVGVSIIIVLLVYFVNASNEVDSIKWVKSLTETDVKSIELIVQPSNENERYRKYQPEEFSEIVKFINQCKGKLISNYEYMDGGIQTFYITTKDGFCHEVTNSGNCYLMIDNDVFDASYDWLKLWDFTGNEKVPEEFLNRPIEAKWSLDQSIGVDMCFLDYASDDFVIFHGYFGLFVYDLNKRKLLRSIDLESIDCNYTQGDNYCDVTVSEDGNMVYLHPMSSENMYVYTVNSNILRETKYESMDNAFDKFVDIEKIMDIKECCYSYNAVEFGNDDYGFLYTSYWKLGTLSADWELGTLEYHRGNKVYNLFVKDGKK